MKFCYLCGKIRQIFDEAKLEKRPTQQTKPSWNPPPPTPKTNRTMVISVSGGWWSGIFLPLFLFSKGQLFEEKKENRPPISDFFCGENSPFCFFFFDKKVPSNMVKGTF